MQKWRLATSCSTCCPSSPARLVLGTVFLKANKIFGRVYFADLSGAGLCGLAFLGAMYLSPPENLIVVPLILWFLGGICGSRRSPIAAPCSRSRPSPSFPSPHTSHCRRPRHPEARGLRLQGRLLRAASFPTASASMPAPRRSDTSRSIPARTCTSRSDSPTTRRSTCRRCPTTPISACTSTARPSGIIRDLPPEQTAYYRFLPMAYPI